jgi:hypothetical protein
MTSKSRQPKQSTADRPAGLDIASLVRKRLESHPTFQQHCQTIRTEWIDDRLVLSGQLPSFHLKQLAQEALSGLGVTIDNQIEVVRSDGLSSVPCVTKLDTW